MGWQGRVEPPGFTRKERSQGLPLESYPLLGGIGIKRLSRLRLLPMNYGGSTPQRCQV